MLRLALVAMLVGGCTVDRRSAGLTCGSQSDCASGRTCDNGYCVAAACPGECSSCDVTAKLCQIDVGGGGTTVTCPADWNCQVTCKNPNACGTVNCTDALSCDITCASRACGNVRCGSGNCKVACNGQNACGTVDCGNACACDVTCPQGDCGTLSCPMSSGSGFCTASGADNQPCMSAINGCNHC